MARKKARDHKRQTKINFSPASQTSRATRSSAAPMAGASQKPQKPTKSSTSRASKKTYQDSTSEDELAQETERGLRIGMFDDRNNHSNGSSSSEEELQVEKQPKSKSKKRRREATLSDSEGEATVVVIPRKRQRHAIKVEIESSEEDKKRKRKKTQAKSEPAPRSTQRGVARKASTPDKEEEEEEEEEDIPPRSVRRKLKRRRPASDDEDEDDDEIHGANKDSASDAEDSDSADDTRDNEEQEELKEDLAFLRSSPVADSRRSTSTTLKNKRQEALEALKRRRAGTTEVSSSATPVRRKTVVIDSESESHSDSELEVIKEEEDSDVEASDQDDSEDEQETNAFDMFQEDQDDEQFIDDTENVIGEPAANDDLDELRLTLSLSRAKTKDLFRHAVEWMVMKKIHPGFEATKNIYTVTFRKLDDEVKGLAGSKYTSAAWTTDFTRAIRARPDLMIIDLSASERAVMSPHCEACNRTNHTASSELFFQGNPYNPDTLEPISTDSDSDSDSDSNSDSDSSSSSALSSDSETLPNGEKPTYNYQKERIPPESHRFPVGSTCKANAQVAHTLYHWRYHLYQWVKDYLKAEGHFTEKKLVKREGWSDRKRAKAAHKIVKRMEEKGQIRELYHSYKNQITAAVEADNRFENGWGRRAR